MTKSFTLDDIRAAAEAKYGNFPVTLDDGVVVKLLNPLQMTKARREALIAEQGRLNSDDENETVDQEQVLESILTIVAENPEAGAKLVAALDGNLALLVTTFENYSRAVQVGEASASVS